MQTQIAGILLIDKNRVLLQLRDNDRSIAFPNKWTIPGGLIKRRELPEMAAKRELEEETGYVSRDCNFLAKFNFINKGVNLVFWVFVENYDNLQKIDCSEGQKMKWILVKDLKKLKLIPVARKALNILVDEWSAKPRRI